MSLSFSHKVLSYPFCARIKYPVYFAAHCFSCSWPRTFRWCLVFLSITPH